MVTSRNYFELTNKEKEIVNEFDSLTNFNSREEFIENSINPDLRYKSLELMEKHPFLLNVDSYFPNNFLNHLYLKKENQSYKQKLEEFESLLNNKKIKEQDILNFIRESKAYFIIGSIFKGYTDFGHHDRYIFPEFPLPPDYQADFLLIGKNSSGYHFCFIELESPYGKIILKSGNFGESIRKGLEQVADWHYWNEKNFSHLKNVFKKHLKPSKILPNEFLEYDNTRISYYVIAGRREDFNEKTYKLAREKNKNNIRILHYDNLIDKTNSLLKEGAY